MKKITIFILTLSCLGCLSCKISSEKPVFKNTESITEDAKSVQIKKTIKDVDYRNQKQDQSLKKRIVVLPFVDLSLIHI